MAIRLGGGSTTRIATYCVGTLGLLYILLAVPYHASSTTSFGPITHHSLWDLTGAAGNLFGGSSPPSSSSEAWPYAPHHVLDNGQLKVDVSSRQHPIPKLMHEAKERWDALVTRQSKTLDEAVAEYRRRYDRNPPKGFDKWFAFAKANHVVLVDEFDQIQRDVEPFLGLTPTELRARIRDMAENLEHSFTFTITNGKLNISGVDDGKDDPRAPETAQLLQRFTEDLPDVTLTFSRHDGPGVFFLYDDMDMLLEAAREGTPPLMADRGGFPRGWYRACETALRPPDDGHEDDHTLIVDHRRSSDLCLNPDIQPLHGFTSWGGPVPGKINPVFCMSKTSVHADILVTPLEQYGKPTGPDPAWNKKKHNKLLWRGSTTGARIDIGFPWETSQRFRLHNLAHAKVGERSVLMPDGKRDGYAVERSVPVETLNKHYLDVSFAGKITQCFADEKQCEEWNSQIDFAPPMDATENNHYKYVIDVDGNGWSGRFHRLLTTRSVVLKSTIFPEWYQDWIQPWLHYIPVKVDYSDIYDVMAFFIGQPDGSGAHDKEAEEIGEAGRQWADKHWRFQDMETYMYRLLLEWARASSPDRVAAEYVHTPSTPRPPPAPQIPAAAAADGFAGP